MNEPLIDLITFREKKEGSCLLIMRWIEISAAKENSYSVLLVLLETLLTFLQADVFPKGPNS